MARRLSENDKETAIFSFIEWFLSSEPALQGSLFVSTLDNTSLARPGHFSSSFADPAKANAFENHDITDRKPFVRNATRVTGDKRSGTEGKRNAEGEGAKLHLAIVSLNLPPIIVSRVVAVNFRN